MKDQIKRGRVFGSRLKRGRVFGSWLTSKPLSVLSLRPKKAENQKTPFRTRLRIRMADGGLMLYPSQKEQAMQLGLRGTVLNTKVNLAVMRAIMRDWAWEKYDTKTAGEQMLAIKQANPAKVSKIIMQMRKIDKSPALRRDFAKQFPE